jgi:hypothetical protein
MPELTGSRPSSGGAPRRRQLNGPKLAHGGAARGLNWWSTIGCWAKSPARAVVGCGTIFSLGPKGKICTVTSILSSFVVP